MKTTCLVAVAAALTSTLAFAQPDAAIGTQIGGGNGTLIGPVPISFPFTFPDGNSSATLFIDTEGRMSNDPALTSSGLENPFNFLSQPTVLAPYWNNLSEDPSSANAGVYLFDSPSVVRVTWVDYRGSTSLPAFTMQVELFPDNSFKFRYDDRVPVYCMTGGIVGVTAGNNPSPSGITEDDLSALSQSQPNDQNVWELFFDFDDFPSEGMDLVDGDLCFTPDPMGGYTLTTTITPPVLAATLPTGAQCGPDPNLVTDSITFTPDGLGGYSISDSGTPDLNYATNGTATGILDDDKFTAPLMFPFTMPGGTVVNSVDITGNGRILEGGTSVAGDFTESVSEFLNDASAMICPLWDDFRPENTTGVGIVFNSTPTVLTITFDGCPEWSAQGTNTFQCQLFADNSITFHYLSIDNVNGQTDGIIGLSAGNGAADPGEIDLSTLPLGGGATLYEQFGGLFAFPDPDLVDLGTFDPATLSAIGAPLRGTTFDLAIAGQPTRVSDAFILGNLLPMPIDLNLIGLDCQLITDGIFGTLILAPDTALSVSIPPNPALSGISLWAQGAVIDPAVGAFGLQLTNGLELLIGDVICP